MSSGRRLLAAALLLVASAAPGVAQGRPTRTPAWGWFLTATVGLVGREIATWKPTHEALAPTGWDSHFQTSCVGFCQNASENVDGRPAVPTIALRRRVADPWQLRLMVSKGSPGYYPGGYDTTTLIVRPTTATVSAQLVIVMKAFWAAAGPSYYHGELKTTAGAIQATGTHSGVGAVLSGGATFPRTTSWFIETVVERRFAGSASTPVIPVPGAPDVPALTVPLSATVLSVGVGWRL